MANINAPQNDQTRAETNACKSRSSKKQEFLEKKKQIIQNLGPDDTILIEDESTFYRSGDPRKIWALKGTKPILRTFGSHEKVNVIGAINPFEDEGIYAYIKTLTGKNFEVFLHKIVDVYCSSGKTYMFLDNARAHHAKLLQLFLESVRDKFELVFLPPYCPDLSEIEKLWQEVKSEVVYNGFYETFDDFENALTRALRRKNQSGYIRSLFNERKYLIRSHHTFYHNR